MQLFEEIERLLDANPDMRRALEIADEAAAICAVYERILAAMNPVFVTTTDRTNGDTA